MKIQSISVVVPTNKCVNNCPFCVSKTHDNEYCNLEKDPLFDRDYMERLEYARDNGTNTIILTGTGEALQNKKFLNKFSKWNKSLKKPFYVIELQTTGVFLNDETLKWLREDIGVKTISLSVSDLFDNENNLNIMDTPNKLRFDLDTISKQIKSFGFNLRISLNVLKTTEKELYINEEIDFKWGFDRLFDRLKELGADQVTFRKLWKSENETEIDKWIDENNADNEFFDFLNFYIKEKGRLLGKLTFGALQYEIGGENGISVVLDVNCMDDKIIKEEIKYLILRENGRLYFKWNSKASLVF